MSISMYLILSFSQNNVLNTYPIWKQILIISVTSNKAGSSGVTLNNF